MIMPVKKQLILPENQTMFLQCHASSLLKIGKNSFLCVFMAGDGEAKPNMSIWMTKCVNGVWGKPVPVKSVYPLPHWNPVLHMDGEHLILYYLVGQTIASWYTRVTISKDLGETWTSSREAVPDDHTPRITSRNKLITLSNGMWLGPCSIEGETHWDCYVDRSSDKGVHWEKSRIPFTHAPPTTLRNQTVWPGLKEGALSLDDPAAFFQWDGVIQPTLWESQPGMVHAFMRSTRGYVYRSDSSDYGCTWSDAYPTSLPNNNSGIDLVKLEDNHLVLAYNPIQGNWGMRTPLTLAYSKDNGESFTHLTDLETDPGEYSYPCIIAQGNNIYVTYTNNRKNIVFFEMSLP